ncbi:hypothetical protein TNCT_15561 [Trichonephila clavata]|uniref:Uncharacterized protein n=1 Tax=Trichonephila clavata TaxID=2740835 RepID=A0A8X6H049_TRICU|nr:hypothetical protein TNCT_15561 [Trichonephila clavata]
MSSNYYVISASRRRRRIIRRHTLLPPTVWGNGLQLSFVADARVRFAQWLLQQNAQSVNLSSYVLLNKKVVLNKPRFYLWALEYCHGMRRLPGQHRFAIQVWASVVRDGLVKSCHILTYMTDVKDRIFY